MIRVSSICSLVLALATILPPAVADTIYDESLDGELSDDGLQPTFLDFAVGANLVRGTSIPDPLDRDFFSFVIPAAHELTAVLLDDYVADRPGSFLAVQAGPVVTSLDTGEDLLGAILLGRQSGTLVGDDLLDDLGMAPQAGVGFTPPLGPGTYSFWYQETAEATEYGFDFRITPVPEPSGFACCLFGGLVIWLRRTGWMAAR